MSYQSVKALLSKGISRPTLFQVIMPVGRAANDQLEFLCKTASVPEVAADTIVVNGQESLGVVREQVALITYAKPFSITVISDRDYTVYKEMRKWFDTLSKNANPNQSGSSGTSQRPSYYDTVTRTITLKKLEQDGGERYFEPFEIQFNNAYPVRIGEIALDSESMDAKIEFQIDFTYETYTFNDRFNLINAIASLL
jgi:hypothetical protein